jgi:hypothetical protein
MESPARQTNAFLSADLSIIVNWNTRDLLAQCLQSVYDMVWDALWRGVARGRVSGGAGVRESGGAEEGQPGNPGRQFDGDNADRRWRSPVTVSPTNSPWR